MSKNTRNRILLTAVAALLLVAVTIAGTVAYLQDYTNQIVNTFEATGIDIDLYETKNPDGTTPGVENPRVTDWTAEMIPGETYSKNPIVTVIRSEVDEDGNVTKQGTDVEVYLFVKYEGSVTNLTYDCTLLDEETGAGENGWTKLDAATGVYYRTVKVQTDAGEEPADNTSGACTEDNCVAEDIHWHLLANDRVSIATTVEKDDGTNAIAGGELKWTAYAIQTASFNGDVGAAWTAIKTN